MPCVLGMETSAKITTKEKRKRRQLSPGQALKASLRQAAAQKRLTIGLSCVVNRLKSDPDTVMACLLLQRSESQGRDEVACTIQHTLLQAFCTENRISTVRVTPDASLLRLASQLAGKIRRDRGDGCGTDWPADCSLLVIEQSASEPSPEDLVWMRACQAGCLNIKACGHLPSD